MARSIARSVRHHAALFATLALLALLLASCVHAVDEAGKDEAPLFDTDMPLIHGSRNYAHLDCSACLTVAQILGDRMNTSLKESSPSILVSHRLEKTVGDRRIDYRGSELRAIEIMENACNQPLYRENVLRLNAKNKVREYHIVFQKTMIDADRTALLEDTKFPLDEEQDFAYNALRVPVAKHYSRSEQDAFRERVPEVMCSFLMEEREEAVSAIIRHAEYLTEVEENLCGYKYDGHPQPTTGQAWEGLASPALHVCANPQELTAAAQRDQRRWTHWNQRNTAALKAHETAAAPAEADPTTGDL